jgi:hypothetical protein
MAVHVVPECAEEVDFRAELRQHGGDDAAAPGGAGEALPRVQDLTRPRVPDERDEIDPFDVADDCQAISQGTAPRSFSERLERDRRRDLGAFA